MTEAEIAYAAGIWEGEGSTAIYIGSGPTRNGIVYAVSVNQKNPALLHWLAERFKGGVYQNYKQSRQCGEWRVTGNGGYAFLKAIQPYIIGRKEEVAVMLEAWLSRSDRGKLLELAARRKIVRAQEH